MNVLKRNTLFGAAAIALSVILLSGFDKEVRNDQLNNIRANFANPPATSRPGVYWYFMDGNLSRQGITDDLEAMKKAGIGNVVFLEVNVGVPRGKVDFLSEEWQELFTYAVRESERLGITITLGVGPGWAGSGGPWVQGKLSMQHLVSSVTVVDGAAKSKIILPVPDPKKPYFDFAFTPELEKRWKEFYEDVAVLAFPEPAKSEKITGVDDKALYYRAPYTSTPNVSAYIPSLAVYPEASAEAIIPKENIINLTDKLQPDGVLNWLPPAGRWTVMRFGVRNNGAVTRPAPLPGVGFEADKFDTTAMNAHLDNFTGKLLKRIGKPNPALQGGLKALHIDSWEMGAQNWTPHFRDEFIKRRGYDPLPFYPVYSGNIVQSTEVSERFLWDLRQTSMELALEYHAGHIKKYAHRNGLTLSIEPYDMNPTSDLELGAIADVPMCEFWSRDYGFNAVFSCIEAASIAHVNGIATVASEALTAQDNEGWKQHPASVKEQGDWAFTTGINKFYYHTFQHQFLDDRLRPGMTMGPYGVHWDRNQTWWPMADAYHQYISRCQYVLRQGKNVADILYLAPEGSPNVFRAPASALVGDERMPDHRGYNFDACAPSQLLTASVKNNKVVFPSGASYKLLVMPAFETMTPALLKKVEWLVKNGATVVGCPPKRSPGLAGYPQVDAEIKAIANTLWGGTQPPDKQTIRNYGAGKLIWGGEVNLDGKTLYPGYDLAAQLLKNDHVAEDFTSTGPVRYIHRTAPQWDIYFIANKTGKPLASVCTFRAARGTPELWDPLTGKTSKLTEFAIKNGLTTVPLEFDAYQSYFVVFGDHAGTVPVKGKNFKERVVITTLNKPWSVHFDTAWGGPDEVTFNQLSDWKDNAADGIKYYSGTAVYSQRFDMPAGVSKGNPLYLDLGVVKNMARVHINGHDLGVLWTAPWKVDISRYVTAKNNVLKIEVVNLWVNRLVGDEYLPDDGIRDGQWPDWLKTGTPRTSGRYTFTTAKHYDKNSPLQSSGLLGPVTIQTSK